ncbi:MAG: peptidoglycan editing factor PgeF [Chloroflexi bacterium]|nr:peptidoglycan editing factor PgeF [Chloroflexota bacterium]
MERTSGTYRFNTLDPQCVPHAVFTRQGGVSTGAYSALNVGFHVGDREEAVRENHTRIQHQLGVAALRWVKQVHGAQVAHIVDGHQPAEPIAADGMITTAAGIGLLMRFADCVPIILYDPVRHVLGMAHAGWRGTVAGVAPAVVQAMGHTFGSDPADIIAGIGPAICGACYEVGPEVTTALREALGPAAEPALLPPPDPDGRPHVDLPAANRIALEGAGVQHIEVAGICTATSTGEFYSHRAEAGHTGRFAVVAALA